MTCANCGKTYEEHQSGLAYRDFTGAGMECSHYSLQCRICWDSGQVMRSDPADAKAVFYDPCPNCTILRACIKCGEPTKFYENRILCLKCETFKEHKR